MRGRLREDELQTAVKAAIKQMIIQELANLPSTEEEAQEVLSGYGGSRRLERSTHNLRVLLNVWFKRGYASRYADENPGEDGEKKVPTG